MDSNMKNHQWELINDFRSLNEFEQLEKFIDVQIDIGDATEVAVEKPYLNASAFREKWYCHLASGEVWRLVWPDVPFTGLFEPVQS
jgi:hypothetical protein